MTMSSGIPGRRTQKRETTQEVPVPQVLHLKFLYFGERSKIGGRSRRKGIVGRGKSSSESREDGETGYREKHLWRERKTFVARS